MALRTTPSPTSAAAGSSRDFGIRPWVGAMVRGNDKMKRLQKFAREGSLANEPVVDSFRDLAVYAIIGLVLYEADEGLLPTQEGIQE